jgi:hypothetical protein
VFEIPHRRVFKRLGLCVLFLFVVAAPSAAFGQSTVTVGPDGDCDYADLQDAIDAAVDGSVIRLAEGLDHAGRGYMIFFPDSSFTIRGGFADCNLDTKPSGRTDIDVADNNSPVINVYHDGPLPDQVINLENLTLRNSRGDAAAGLRVRGRIGQLQVNLRNVEVTSNRRTGGTDPHGAGIRVLVIPEFGTLGPVLTVDDDSIISDNVADGRGGGLYCEASEDPGNRDTIRIGKTPIIFNEAGMGGGLAVNGCRNVHVHSGGEVLFILPTGGIVLNEASGSGGGLLVEDGGEVIVNGDREHGFGDPQHAALILANSAQSGGGARIKGAGSRLELIDTFVENNEATVLPGGAFWLDQGAEMVVRRTAGTDACEPVTSGGGSTFRPRCSVIAGNAAPGEGGAFFVRRGSSVDISRTIINANSSSALGNPSFAYVGNGVSGETTPATMRIEGSVISGHTTPVALVDDNGELEISHSTIAGNDSGGLIRMETGPGDPVDLSILSSIVEHPDPVLDLQGSGDPATSARCVISNQPPTDFDTASFYSQIDPRLTALEGGVYKPGFDSPAIDYCDNANAPAHRGLGGNVRGQAWGGPAPVSPPNAPGGPYDLGAHELVWPGDSIFSDRFQTP